MFTRCRCLPTLVAAIGILGLSTCPGQSADTRCYELRIYHAAPGKLDDLHQRFRNHTMKLFEKHGMQNIAYWTPVQNSEDPRLIYLLAYPSREARDASWKGFMEDPDWQAAFKASEAKGGLVQKVEHHFLSATDYSPEVKPGVSMEPRVFELREYTATAGHLDRLHARFRDHTVELFRKHGIQSFGYWSPTDGEAGHDSLLIYIVWHPSTEAAASAFAAFGKDPDWKSARETSEKEAGGSLTVPGGVHSTFMVATDYSPTR